MIKYFCLNCTFFGDYFYPDVVEKELGILFERKRNPVLDSLENGYAKLSFDAYKEQDRNDMPYLNDLVDYKDSFFRIIEEIVKRKNEFKIEYMDIYMPIKVKDIKRTDIGFSPELLKVMAKCKSSLSISVWE